MKLFFTKSLGILAVLAFLSSCSSLENLSVKWKYRNDYWVKKSDKAQEVKTTVSEKEIKPEEINSVSSPTAESEKRSDKSSDEKSTKNKKSSSEISQKDVSLGTVLKSETDSKPKSILEKKLSKLNKKVQKANDNGSTWGIIAFIFGLLGFIGLFLYGPLVILSLLALIFGIIGASGGKDGKGWAIAGIILAIVTLLVLLFGIALFSAAFF